MQAHEYIDISWRSLLLMCLVTAIVASAVTIASKSVERKACLYLSAFLVVFCLNVVPQIIGFSGFYQAYPWLSFAPFNNELWLGPLLFLHTLALTKQRVPSYLKMLFIPATIQTVYYTIVFISIDDYRDKWVFSTDIHSIYIAPIESILTISVSIFCIITSYQSIRRYRFTLYETQSDTERFDTSWLIWLISLMGLLVFVWTGFEFVHRFVNTIHYPNQYPFHVLFLTILVFLSQRAVSSIVSTFPKPVQVINDDKNASDAQIQVLANNIAEKIYNEKLFLNEQLSLSDLSRILGTNENYASRAINQGLNKNFNQLINDARVEYAIELLDKDLDYRFLDLMYDAGFKSKASFNRAFKLVTGITPSLFVEQKKKNLSKNTTEVV